MTPEPEPAQTRKTPHKQRGRNVDKDVRDEVAYLAISRGMSGAAIARALDLDVRFRGRVPAERTVQAIARSVRGADVSGPWTMRRLGQSAPVDPAAVLPVLGWLINFTDGFRLTISQREAQWVTAIVQAAPDILPAWALDLALRYIAAEATDQSTEQLDRALALRIWESDSAYTDAVGIGAIPDFVPQHFRLRASPAQARSRSGRRDLP